MTEKSIEQRIDRLQVDGVIDMHFDLPMDLYEKRDHKTVLETEFLPELEAGNIGVMGVAIYIEDRYLPDAGLRVALDQREQLVFLVRLAHVLVHAQLGGVAAVLVGGAGRDHGAIASASASMTVSAGLARFSQRRNASRHGDSTRA